MAQACGGLILTEAKRGDGSESEGPARNERPSSGQAVLVSSSARSWVHRFEVRGAWPFVSAAEVHERFEQLVHHRWVVTRTREVAVRSQPHTPPADVFVVDGEIWIEVDLPGVAPETLRVRLDDGDLRIEAERRSLAPAQGARAAAVERPSGLLRRRVPLPLRVGAARLEWQFEDGILQVRVRPGAESS